MFRAIVREKIGTFRVLLVLRLLQWPVRAVTRPLIRRLKRDPSLVVFGAASGRFADNPAYAFLACADDPDLHCVWISRSRATVAHIRSLGLRAERRWHPRGIRTVLRAGWVVYGWHVSDVNLWLSDGAKTFNLWHGVGVKRIQRSRVVGAGAAIYAATDGSLVARVFEDDRRPPDYVLSTSSGMTAVLAQAFGVPHEQCVEVGYPRNDHLIDQTQPPQGLVDKDLLQRLQSTTVVGYFPTFRDDSVSFPGGAPGVAELAATVGQQGAVLLFKAHDASDVRPQATDSLIVLPHHADLNAYLGACDVLVTDYSSVASDFLLLRRPIVLFVPDIDAYDTIRGFALDPTAFLPGIVTRTKDELAKTLERLNALPLPENHGDLQRFYWGEHPRAAGPLIRNTLRKG